MNRKESAITGGLEQSTGERLMRAGMSIHVDTPLCAPMHFSKNHVVEQSGGVVEPVQKHGRGWYATTMRGRQSQWTIRWRSQLGHYQSEPPVMPHMVDELLSFDNRDWRVEYLLPVDGQWVNLVGAAWWVLDRQPVGLYHPHPHIDVLPGRVGGEPTLTGSRLPVPNAVGAYQEFVNEGRSPTRAAEQVCEWWGLPDPQHVLSALNYAGSRHHLSLEHGKYRFCSYCPTRDCA